LIMTKDLGGPDGVADPLAPAKLGPITLRMTAIYGGTHCVLRAR